MANRKFTRESSYSKYRLRYYVEVEGKTENGYFELLRRCCNKKVVIELSKNCRKSAPQKVLERALKILKENQLKKSDEIWLVIDHDERDIGDLQKIFEKSSSHNIRIAFSNPNFEYWVLLHYEDGNGVRSKSQCNQRLLKNCPNYDKTSLPEAVLLKDVSEAINRAKKRYISIGAKSKYDLDSLYEASVTTIYQLVEKIL